MRSRQLLTIFREGKYGQQDVDVAILQALFKGVELGGCLGHEGDEWSGSHKLGFGDTKGFPRC